MTPVVQLRKEPRVTTAASSQGNRVTTTAQQNPNRPWQIPTAPIPPSIMELLGLKPTS